MTKCESEELPCYNKAEYIMKICPITFGKHNSNIVNIVRLCKQCYNIVNPDNKKVTYVDEEASFKTGVKSLYECGITNKDEIYDNIKMLQELGEIKGYRFTFRRYRK